MHYFLNLLEGSTFNIYNNLQKRCIKINFIFWISRREYQVGIPPASKYKRFKPLFKTQSLANSSSIMDKPPYRKRTAMYVVNSTDKSESTTPNSPDQVLSGISLVRFNNTHVKSIYMCFYIW